MHGTSNTLISMLILTLALFLAGAPELARAAEGDAEARAEADAEAKTQTEAKGRRARLGAQKGVPRVKVPVAPGPQDKKALWWNDPGVIKVLSLSDEQRATMDVSLRAYREKLPSDRRPIAFHEALVQGDWQQARRENDKVAGMAEKSVRMRGNLKIDILSMLSEEQKGLLVDGYPQLIYKPWARAMGGAQR